jgi:DNA-binding LacI/PurR family transcriptional regulator
MDNRLRNNNEPQQKNITINDVADSLGLSKTTISRALSGKGRIGTETRERVLSYITEHGYQPNLIAKSLAVSKTFNIAVTLPTDTEEQEIPFFQTCLHSITETVTARDYDVVLSVMTGQDPSALKRLLRNQKVDGVILTRLVSDDKALALLRESGIPFAVIGSIHDTSITQVDSDHCAGCREVMEHVLKTGCRKNVLLAGNPGYKVNKDRYEGYVAALARAGFQPDTASEFWNVTDSASVDAILRDVMAQKPDCLVCMDDVICTRVLVWLHKKGYHVPSDVKIVSFHDSRALEQNEPPITALHINVPALGSMAGTVLLNEIEGKPFDRVNGIGYSLCIRDSSRT